MADRNQNYPPGRRQRQDWRDDDQTRRGSNRPRDDEGRFSGAEDRDYGYGSYTDTDEGESSVRAGSYDQGREQSQYGRSRDTGGQSGSTGRYAGYGDFGQGRYSGQGNYGQTGYGQGGYGQGNYGQPSYGYERGRGGESEGGRYSQGTFGTERGGWREPYGEGQQYTSRGDYAGSVQSGYSGRGTAAAWDSTEARGRRVSSAAMNASRSCCVSA